MIWVLLSILCRADDPSPGWLSYAIWTAPNEGKITQVNATWTVPSDPKLRQGSNAPGWWFGIQTTKGDGALIQPILAYGYTGSRFSIFNGVFDWTDTSWHTSPKVYTVKPDDVITSSIVYDGEESNSYTMYISTPNTKVIKTSYKLEAKQTAPE